MASTDDLEWADLPGDVDWRWRAGFGMARLALYRAAYRRFRRRMWGSRPHD